MQKSPVLLSSLLPQHTGDHLNAGLPQLSNPATSHAGIRILEGHHHPGDPSSQHRFTAGGSAAVMAAGFQGDHKGSTKGRISRLGQGPHLGMGLSGAGMEALTNQSALPAQNHSPHQGIGTGASFS